MAALYAPLIIRSDIAQRLDAISADFVTQGNARQVLGDLLQNALCLEFATIPIYLAAAFSLSDSNKPIRQLIMRAAIEEMLHFTVVANTMNAIGIAPDIDAAVPSYPCDLDLLTPPLHLELESFSVELIERTFLRIETPREPIHFRKAMEDVPRTVGEFYEGIIEILESDKIPDLFRPSARNAAVVPDPPNFPRVAYRDENDQGTYPLPASIDFAIVDSASAVRHLRWLVDQGEGTSRTDRNPIDSSGLPAHYYRFHSILKGKYLVEDANAELGFSYSGGSLSFDGEGVHECDPNPRVANYTEQEALFRQVRRFARSYSQMIDELKTAFTSRDGERAKEAYMASVGTMRSMSGLVTAIFRASDQAGVKGGLPFERSA
jgi:hypothetical protein